LYEGDVFKLTNGVICWYTFSRRCSYVYMWLRKWHCHMRLLHNMFSKLDIIQSSATLYKLRKSDITTSNDTKKRQGHGLSTLRFILIIMVDNESLEVWCRLLTMNIVVWFIFRFITYRFDTCCSWFSSEWIIIFIEKSWMRYGILVVYIQHKLSLNWELRIT